MTDAEILAIIKSDPDATAKAAKRDDAGCTARLAEIVPPEATKGRYYDERTLYDAFGARGDVASAEAILQGLDAIGEANPLVKRVRSWLSPEKEGIDLGNATVRAFIQQLSTDPDAGKVFTADRVAVLLSLGEAKPTITTDDVSRVLADAKANGIKL